MLWVAVLSWPTNGLWVGLSVKLSNAPLAGAGLYSKLAVGHSKTQADAEAFLSDIVGQVNHSCSQVML